MIKIGILCAGDSELEPFFPEIEECQVSEKAMLKVYEGKMEGVRVAALFSGVCKVNAAIAAQILIDTYGCEMMINAGTAGAMAKEIQVFDTIVSTECAYHDVAEDILTDFHPWLPSVYFQADENLLSLAKKAAGELAASHHTVFGRMVTGETFIEEEKRDEIVKAYAPLCVDMETAAVAHVCYVNRIPFLAVRTATDTAGVGSSNDFEANCEKASRLSAEFVTCMLRELKNRNGR